MHALLLLPIALGVISGWILLGLGGLLAPHSTRWVAHGLFPAGALGSAVIAGVGVAALFAPATVMQLSIGLPGLPMHLRLDALSGFFLLLLGVSSVGTSVFAAGYFRTGEGTAPGLLGLQYHVFLAAMSLVMLAADAYTFMLAWEVMALSSYFLVVTQHRMTEIRSAGFIYLLLAHLGAIALLLCFGVMMAGGMGGLTFAAMRAHSLSHAWASVAFGLAVLGFGAKAGLVPLHIWLPEAHPAAPSPVSALMSGVMLKTALYGLLRVSLDLLHAPLWWWGVPLLVLGLFGALFGVLFAAVQSDMKRLLAYSSIENIGIAFTALGLALVFHGVGMPLLAALALAAMLYHALNHAMFKSLLFLATGSVLHATRQRSLGSLGGLLRRMPWVGWTALVGTLAIAGLPPLNGFIAEWLLLQAFLFTPSVPQPFFNMLIPLGAAVLVLTAALAAYVMVKFYGVIFLGRHREPQLEHAHDPGWLERCGLVWLAAGCILLGLLPGLVLQWIDRVNLLLLGQPVAQSGNWFWLVPMSAQRASYNPGIVLLVGVLVIGLTVWFTHRVYTGRTRRVDAWDCGAPGQTARMQDTAEGFGQPIRRLFAPFFQTHAELPLPADAAPRYRVVVSDKFWPRLYTPLAEAVLWLAQRVGRIQQGRTSIYLLYSFVTLLVLLMVVVR
ncbi:MAG: hydrogenase 4 subunit B [Burkholderiales bacterium]|jgi:formate hydrogenlyase subunit 3/multisubunit Na+/H+ antiporter MnhD subunit|nr:hydrogenase 4 subunit B [Burkholderiales bacterium]